ncbi:hypothetical protein Athai_38720 [Actinocatenispora thailandica]|uniref:Glycosyltransferase n=1 Tax=Actinocatenispora thailandica TaxID=227318 RepID=A0A7R7DR63_9ACTN|nr:hypothetical protein [Actinocatenispora thailandica]BCJ36369.1 hypothetical protein Athai_38720 [Actinocatenispora thailandica]
MLVGVCDFPSAYDFPPAGYGGIERWLWAVAIGARRSGADVHLLGPQWRTDLHGWTVRPYRLEDLDPHGATVAGLRADRYDLLIVGHEYPSLPRWREVADRLGCDVATFQHDPRFQHAADAFNGRQRRLYCYSPEMSARYVAHHPAPELAVHLGHGEQEPAAVTGTDLVWLGRIDRQKAPHLAAQAAGLLGRRIRIVGPIFDPGYVDEHRDVFAADHVEMVGELGGAAKTAAFAHGSVFVYTCARDYVEAGAAVFGEALRAGTPVAALTWRPGTCADAALCPKTGRIATVTPETTDAEAAHALADAIEDAIPLDPRTVQDTGQARFDPDRHFQALASRP